MARTALAWVIWAVALFTATIPGPGAATPLAPKASGIADTHDPGAAQLMRLYQQAMAARAERRYDAYAAAMEQAWTLEPGHPVIAQHRARALALAGNPQGALEWIHRAAALGAVWDARADTFLTNLHADPQWEAALDDLAHARAATRRSPRAFVLAGDVPLPEGIAWDPRENKGFVGSTLQRLVVRVDALGRTQPFTAAGQDGLLSPLGLRVDVQRGLLWVASSAFDYADGFADSLRGRAALHAFGLADGATRAHWFTPPDSAEHNFNDVVVAPDGTVFVTDASTGAIFATSGPGGPLIERWPAGSFPGANGIAVDEAGELLFVAEYTRGVAVVQLPAGPRWRLDGGESNALAGIDGLYFTAGALVAVQNYGGLNRVARFELDASRAHVTATRVLEAWHPDFEEPTTAAIAGSYAYVLANTQLNRIGPDGSHPPVSELGAIVVLKVGL